MQVHVIGASGRSGTVLCRALAADGIAFVPVVRNPAKWQAAKLPGAPAIAELADSARLRDALAAAALVVSCAHARYVPAILAAAPPGVRRFVFLGSTRKFTNWLDGHARGVLAGEAAFLQSGRPGVMLHPTMIYGAAGEDNVQRLAALLRRLPLVPLPGGGRALVQPIYQDDLTRAIRAALAVEWRGPEAIVLAGPDRISYAGFVRAVARAAGLGSPRILPVPAWMLQIAAPATRILPGIPTVRRAELQRLLEDKAFDIGPMRSRLGLTPIDLAEGLRQTFAAATI